MNEWMNESINQSTNVRFITVVVKTLWSKLQQEQASKQDDTWDTTEQQNTKNPDSYRL